MGGEVLTAAALTTFDQARESSSHLTPARRRFFLGIEPSQVTGVTWSRWESHRGLLSPRLVFSGVLTALFLLSFSVPILVATYFGGFFEPRAGSNQGKEELFPDSFSINQADVYVEVQPGDGLDVIAGKDFLMTSWFKLRKIPISGDRIVLVGKFPDEKKPREGFGLGLFDDHGLLRPMIFWGTKDGGGRWYRFSEFEVPARVWVMFAVSLREGRFLGLHVAAEREPGKWDVQLLGGYDIGSDSVPALGQSLVTPALNQSRYVSRIGPLGIFHKPNLTQDLKDIVKKVARNPKEIPSEFSAEDIGLWIPDMNGDKSGHAHQVSLRNDRPNKR